VGGAAALAILAAVVVAANHPSDRALATGPMLAQQQTALQCTHENPRMWAWMQSHWDEIATMQEHWGDVPRMQTHMTDWASMQSHRDDMTWMHQHWQGMTWMHGAVMNGGPASGGMMGN